MGNDLDPWTPVTTVVKRYWDLARFYVDYLRVMVMMFGQIFLRFGIRKTECLTQRHLNGCIRLFNNLLEKKTYNLRIPRKWTVAANLYNNNIIRFWKHIRWCPPRKSAQ